MPFGSLYRRAARVEVIDCRGEHRGLDVEVVDGRFKRHLALEVLAGGSDRADDGFRGVVCANHPNHPPFIDCGHQRVPIRRAAQHHGSSRVGSADQLAEVSLSPALKFIGRDHDDGGSVEVRQTREGPGVDEGRVLECRDQRVGGALSRFRCQPQLQGNGVRCEEFVQRAHAAPLEARPGKSCRSDRSRESQGARHAALRP